MGVQTLDVCVCWEGRGDLNVQFKRKREIESKRFSSSIDSDLQFLKEERYGCTEGTCLSSE